MTGRPLILSLFPGIDLLGLAFQQEWPECCIVRGPDVIWGSLHKIETFHPPVGVFDGVIGGPPCQAHTTFGRLRARRGLAPRFGNLVPEFERVVWEAQPAWWLMENVPLAPVPAVPGYAVHAQLLDNRWLGGEQQRLRRFSLGTRHGARLDVQLVALEAPVSPAVTVTARHNGRLPWRVPATVHAGHGAGPRARARGEGPGRYPLPEACRLQGLPLDFLEEGPFTAQGKLQLVANAVSLDTGRAVARAVRRAVEGEAPC